MSLIENAPVRGLWLMRKWDSQLKRSVIERPLDGNTGLSLCICVTAWLIALISYIQYRDKFLEREGRLQVNFSKRNTTVYFFT